MATITYKGKEKEIKIDNRAIMQFEMMGGNLASFEKQPVSSAIMLACAALGLKGDPLDHANHLPAMSLLPAVIQEAMKESGLNESAEGKDAGTD